MNRKRFYVCNEKKKDNNKDEGVFLRQFYPNDKD